MKCNFSTSRRNLLIKASTAAIASQISSTTLFAKPNQTKFTLKDLDQQIIEQAKKLTDGKAITLSILQPQGSLGNVKPVGDKFSELTNITINYIESALDEINTKILAQSLSDEIYFDIALPATFGLPDLIEAGSIRDLGEFVNTYEPKNFYNDMLYPTGDFYKNKFYGYQTDGDTYLMFYNKAWLEDETEQNNFKKEYGYPLAVPKTWEQLDQMIKFFHRPDDNMYGGALFRNKDYIAWEWWTRFHAKGLYPFNNKLQPQIDSASGIEALTELLETTNNLYPQAKTNGLFENWEAFAEGNMFCNIGWGGTQKYLNGPKSKIKDNLAFGPAPGGIVNNDLLHTPYFNWGWNYTVSSSALEPEIAYLFTLYACSPKMSTEAVKFADGYFDPFRNEHYSDRDIQETYSEPFLKAHKFSMENSIPDLYLTGQGEYWDILKENIDLANRGTLTPKVALETTAKAWNQISARYGVKDQLEQWLFLKSKYPENIRKKLT